MKRVKAFVIPYQEKENEARANPQREARQIEQGAAFLMPQAAKGSS